MQIWKVILRFIMHLSKLVTKSSVDIYFIWQETPFKYNRVTDWKERVCQQYKDFISKQGLFVIGLKYLCPDAEFF